MSTIAESVAAEHSLRSGRALPPRWDEHGRQMFGAHCLGCDAIVYRQQGTSWYTLNALHVATVTEAAVRARIAADIRAKAAEPFGVEDHWWPGLIAAARIAEGGTS